MTLITPFEVLKYSPAGFDYPTATFCELIPQIEERFARECLGCDLYDYLISKLSSYPTTAVEYDATQTYMIDDLVIRNGCVFVSTADNNTTDPIEPNSDWDAYERFTDAGANQLWTKYLRFILSLKVFSASLIYTTYRSGAGGLVVNQGDGSGFRSGNKTEVITTKTDIEGQVEYATENMIFWLKKNATTLGLPMPGCVQDCALPGNRSRRWGLR